MRINTMTIQGDGGTIEIARTDAGALVTAGDRVVCEVRRNEDREARYAKARDAAAAVYGVAKPGRRWGGGGPNATHSMVHDVLNEIERVAGC
jgi:hypothetical protein